MSSYRQIIYHLIFCTKARKEVIPLDSRTALYKYIHGIVRDKNCVLYAINGPRNHIHLLVDLHPSVALADLIKDIKVASSMWMKRSERFPLFTCWAVGYAAFTYALRDKEVIVNYIAGQLEHHHCITFLDEYKALLNEHGVTFDERYLP